MYCQIFNYSTYNSIRRRNPTRVVNTFDTNNYATIQSGSVSNVLPMLSEYYWRRGIYMSSSNENEEDEQDERNEKGESSSENELIDCSDMSGNSSPAGCVGNATWLIDIRQCLVESTSNMEGIENLFTDIEVWSSLSSFISPSSSPSSLHSSTSAYSNLPLPSYADLLDYSPSEVTQPQPTESILVPTECLTDNKLRCPPVVKITRSTRVDLQAFNNFLWDHFPQPELNIDKEADIQVFNSLPEYVEVFSESDESDIVILE